MKLFFVLLALFPLCLCADEASDRSSIQKVIAGLDESQSNSRKYFASDADPKEVERFLELQRKMKNRAAGPWSEVTNPRILIGAISFVTPEVALVDATIGQVGSSYWRNDPVLFVIKKQGTEWRIAAVRAQSGRPVIAPHQ